MLYILNRNINLILTININLMNKYFVNLYSHVIITRVFRHTILPPLNIRKLHNTKIIVFLIINEKINVR